MKVNDLFPSNFIKVDELPPKKVIQLTIKRVLLETIGDDEKAVVYFTKARKGLPLNKTNASVIAEAFGDDTDMWSGKTIGLKRDKTTYQGKTVPCIRVEIEGSGDAAEPEETKEPEEDEIPF